MNNFFPLPPLSPLGAQRNRLFQELTPLLVQNNVMNKKALLAAFSILLNEYRDAIWEALSSSLEENRFIHHDQVVEVFRAFLVMTLYVQSDSVAGMMDRVGTYDPQLLVCFNPYLETIRTEIPSPCTVEDVQSLMENHFRMVLPITHNPCLLQPPVIHRGQLLALRILAGLGNLLFSQLSSYVLAIDHPLLSKGDFVQIMESILRGKALEPSHVQDIYDRIYQTAQRIAPNPRGISQSALLYMFAAFYPCDEFTASILYDYMADEEGVGVETFTDYLVHFYAILQEVRVLLLFHVVLPVLRRFGCYDAARCKRDY